MHALTCPPECICLQLLRFRQVNGSWVKADNPTWLPRSFIMPVFRSQHTLEVEQVEYTITAITLRRGSAPSMGHYRAILLKDRDLWLTDDGTQAKKIGAVTEMLSRQAYLIWGTREKQTGQSGVHTASATQTSVAPQMRTYSYAEAEGMARSGSTFHFATWQ